MPSSEERPVGVVDDLAILEGTDVPDWMMALETGLLDDPKAMGALFGFQFTRSSEVERVAKVVLCRWPSDARFAWDWSYQPFNAPDHPPDACAVLYWAETVMQPGTHRKPAFSYGLGRAGGWAPEDEDRPPLSP